MGAGLFFIGYFLSEVPANLILRRLGARRWLGPIMIAWGLVSASMMFVTGTTSFYVLRFLLGVVESGFFPGVMLYLTFWYPQERRAGIVGMFMSANPLSGVLAGPVSGWILGGTHDLGLLRPWQVLFLVEGLPSVVAGIATLLYLVDSPAQARWLNPSERAIIASEMEREEKAKRTEGAPPHRFRDAFRSGKVWLLCLAYFGIQMGNYGLAFWLRRPMAHRVGFHDPLGNGSHRHDRLRASFRPDWRTPLACRTGHRHRRSDAGLGRRAARHHRMDRSGAGHLHDRPRSCAPNRSSGRCQPRF